VLGARLIAVDQLDAKTFGDHTADRRLAGTHQPEQDDVLPSNSGGSRRDRFARRR
jgi:hypothetical protein